MSHRHGLRGDCHANMHLEVERGIIVRKTIFFLVVEDRVVFCIKTPVQLIHTSRIEQVDDTTVSNFENGSLKF